MKLYLLLIATIAITVTLALIAGICKELKQRNIRYRSADDRTGLNLTTGTRSR